MEAGNYTQATLLFTQAIQAYQGVGGQGKAQQEALATLHGYRCESLYEVGAYEASAYDAKRALEYERLSRPSVGGHPYSSSGGRTPLLHPAKYEVLRAKVLCSLGYSFLRGGNSLAASDAFKDSISSAQKALEYAEDLTENERKSSSTHERAVTLVKDTIEKATEGKSIVRKYEALKTKLETGSYKKDHFDLLNSVLEIAPAAVDWHEAKVKYLVGRGRWFAVANHCEQVAARASKYDGIFKGDLASEDPFAGVPPLKELSSDFFTKDYDVPDQLDVPEHLRTLSPKAACDAAFRIPEEILPYYLRALRLEERYKEAVTVGTALAEFDAQPAKKDVGADNFAKNKRFEKEWDKLDRTIKLKEEADALFRDAYYDRAVTLYGECLAIDGDGASGSGSILRQTSSWPVACAQANKAGGKLHAVLHSNRAACFSSMGRYDDAIKESSHALSIHSMYTKAILRRARCYAKKGQSENARADYNRYINLVEGAREHPYPPPNVGSACYFDMPSAVAEHQLNEVKREMNDLGMRPISVRRNLSDKRSTWLDDLLSNFCCKKNVQSQVVNQPSFWQQGGNGSVRYGGSSERGDPRRRVSFSNDRAPPPQSFRQDRSTLIKQRPAFDHPLDPSDAVDTNIDFYSLLGLSPTASDSEIKQAYHKLARECHPDRNDSKEAQARFEEIKLAYSVLRDTKGKREYDRAKVLVDP